MIFTLIFALTIPYSQLLIADDTKIDQAAVNLIFVGDIFLGNWAVEFFKKEGMDYPYMGCSELFKQADLVVGNLEKWNGPVTGLSNRSARRVE